MMMGGGALKAMNDAIKLNRENLKANKKKPFEKSFSKSSFSDELVAHDKKCDEGTILLIRASVLDQQRKDRIKKVIVFVASLLLCTLLATYFWYS